MSRSIHERTDKESEESERALTAYAKMLRTVPSDAPDP